MSFTVFKNVNSFDLLYEWLVEIRERIFLSEYFIVWATFIAIQIVGMDAGILIGILVSIVDHVVHAAKTTGVYRVNKQSRAIWSPDEYKIIQNHGYSYRAPSIVALGMYRQ
jgi:MFS superfamily sulfate permease-like transporter